MINIGLKCMGSGRRNIVNRELNFEKDYAAMCNPFLIDNIVTFFSVNF
jgi:hypothetical protein